MDSKAPAPGRPAIPAYASLVVRMAIENSIGRFRSAGRVTCPNFSLGPDDPLRPAAQVNSDRNNGRTTVTAPRPGLELAEAFAPFDRTRLVKSDLTSRTAQLAARQLLYDYVAELWNDVDRAGERPSVGEKYQAIASLRELTEVLRSTAFEAVYGSRD